MICLIASFLVINSDKIDITNSRTSSSVETNNTSKMPSITLVCVNASSMRGSPGEFNQALVTTRIANSHSVKILDEHIVVIASTNSLERTLEEAFLDLI